MYKVLVIWYTNDSLNNCEELEELINNDWILESQTPMGDGMVLTILRQKQYK